VRFLGFQELVRGWAKWRRYVRAENRRRGLDFLVAWLTERRPELV
jgi:hypothetical protein